MLALIRAFRERERRQAQTQAVIAFRHAVLINRVMAGRRVPEVWEAFPFWPAEEIKALRLEQTKTMLRSMGVKGGGDNG